MTSAVFRTIARAAKQARTLAVAGVIATAATAATAAAAESSSAALARWTRQAESGDAAAQYELGRRLSSGDGVPMDRERGRVLFELSAQQNFAKSEYELARHYDGQTGQAFDRKRSFDYLQRAAQHGDVPAQVDLAFRYLNGSEIVPKDPVQSFRWFTSAASRGSTIANCMLADFHRDGRGGARQDDRKALELYRRTATTLDACARKSQYELYRMYEAGRGTPKNLTAAVGWLKKSAQAGNPIAQAALGRAYLQGKDLPKNEEEGRFWLKQSRKGVAPHDDGDHDDVHPGAHDGSHRHP
jgi:TPR repeat protein